MGDPSDIVAEPEPVVPSVQPLTSIRNLQPIALLVAAMLLLGIWLRVHAFGFPNSFIFDEHHFVENARNYLHHQADWNDHPPLGKLIIAQSMHWLGDNSIGWRIPSLVFGFVTIIAGGFAVRRLFRGASAGWLAAAFLSVDGFLISYSRAALLDGFLAASLAVALLVATLPLNVWTALAAGVILGIAVSIKFSGIAVALPLVTAAVLARAPRRKLLVVSLLFGVAALAVYYLQYSRGLVLALKSATPAEVVKDTQRLLDHHAALTDMKNPWTSGWITWALPTRPALLNYSRHFGEVRVLSGLGNLALWWPGVWLTVACVVGIFAKGVISILAPSDAPTNDSISIAAFLTSQGRAVLVLLAGSIGFVAPWVLSHRDSYIYHFLPAYAAIIMLLAGYVDWVRRRKSIDALLFVGLVLLVAAFYAPIWSSMLTSEAAVNARLFFRGWR
jgi:dolichyl-phosphate-mannose-protein mannosyltransferase